MGCQISHADCQIKEGCKPCCVPAECAETVVDGTPLPYCSAVFAPELAAATAKLAAIDQQPRRPVLKSSSSTASIIEDDLPPCPMVGCSLAFLISCAAEWACFDKFKAGSGIDFTMGNVCNYIIKPCTRECSRDEGVRLQDAVQAAFRRSAGNSSTEAIEEEAPPSALFSFAELAMREDLRDTRGQPAFAKATHFVSHAWRYVFSLFVEALHHWVETSGADQDETYFWVDAFVVNQHQSANLPQEWWSTRFMHAVGDMGNTILVLEPWHDPVSFKRAWVIWELYSTSVTGAKLHITMKPDAMKDFNNTLVTSFEKVQTALSSIDCASSEAFHQCDQEMIHSEVMRTIGFTKLNELIQTKLMQWLTEAAKNYLRVMVNDKDTDFLSRAALEENLGRMLRETGNADEAATAFAALLVEVTQKLGSNHLFTLSCMNQLAVTYQKLGKTDEALQMHRTCLQHRVQVLGPMHADSLQSISNLAVLLSTKEGGELITVGAFEEAQALFRQAISGRETGSGPNHPTTLYTISNLGKLLSNAPVPTLKVFDEAETLHRRAVDKLIEVLHSGHPLALTASHNQACHWLALFHFKKGQAPIEGEPDWDLLHKATRQLKSVRNSRTAFLGKNHPETLLTENALTKCGNLGLPNQFDFTSEVSLKVDDSEDQEIRSV